MKIFHLNQIQKKIQLPQSIEALIRCQKSAFIDFSLGAYDVPAPMQFIFPAVGGDCHVKGGYQKGSPNLFIKIANSSKAGHHGLILVFEVSTGEVKAILEDQGFLTTLRTAIAGLLVLEIIPGKPSNIGMIGSGNLARQLYTLLRMQYPQTNIMLYARNHAQATSITDSVCDCVEDLVEQCDIIFTATSSQHPIIQNIPQGSKKAVIALGSDDGHKSELSYELFAQADRIIVDSKLQAAKFGDVARALRANTIPQDALLELGTVLKSGIPEIAKTIIADFSGIGAQDVALAEWVLSRLLVSEV